jgi:hypothetical protein
MSPLRAALSLLMTVATCLSAESVSRIARWPDLVAQAKDCGVDYPPVAARAERRDRQALSTIFRVTACTDGSGATSHCSVLRVLLERLSDSTFSQALRSESSRVRTNVVQALDFDFGEPWQKKFPRTYMLGTHDARLLRGKQ